MVGYLVLVGGWWFSGGWFSVVFGVLRDCIVMVPFCAIDACTEHNLKHMFSETLEEPKWDANTAKTPQPKSAVTQEGSPYTDRSPLNHRMKAAVSNSQTESCNIYVEIYRGGKKKRKPPPMPLSNPTKRKLRVFR